MPNNDNMNNDNEFDWDEYERSLRGDNTGTDADVEQKEPSRRRTQQSRVQKQKKRAAKTKKKAKKKKRKTVWRKIRFGILIALIVAIVVTSGIGIGMYAAVYREISSMNIQNLALNTTSKLYYTDDNGGIHELHQLQSETNRIWVSSSEISDYAKKAIVAIEDERFYEHSGVDIKRTAGATAQYMLSKVGIGSASYGGSTITQQVIKNLTNDAEKTSGRKVKEILRAIALEKQLSKDEILTLYLNIAYFANNCYGIEAAANRYFSKSASELNLQEAAAIAGITQYPSEFDPITNPAKNTEKRNLVLGKMLELNYISEAQYTEAVNSKLKLDESYEEARAQMTSYFVDQVINDVIRDLVEQKGYSEGFASQQVYNGGYKIYTTIDMDVQEAMEEVFEDTSNFPKTGMDGQSAMAVIDPYTGEVKGIIGGIGSKKSVRGWSRASDMRRQPGSSIKPLSVYGPAIDRSEITEASIIKDEQITIGSDNWKPKNSYSGFKGDMTVREAVARSSNIPAVKVLDQIGIGTSYSYLKNKFHFSSITDDDKNYSSLSLGGLTKGVSPLEMAAAYSTFVNGGKYIAPHTYYKVEDASGNEIMRPDTQETQAISPAAAYITADLLSSVVNSSVGTGKDAKLDDNMPTYGKTGTTDNDYDKWFVGFTPYYVGAVWYGFDSPSSVTKAGVTGNPCTKAWRLVMDEIHNTLPTKELDMPDNVVEEKICLETGKKAVSGCDSISAYFIEGTQPRDKCNDRPASTPKPSTSPSPDPSEKPSATSTPKPSSKNEDDDDERPSSSSSGSGSSNSGSSGGSSSSGSTSSNSGSGSSSSSSNSSDRSPSGSSSVRSEDIE